MSSIKDFTKGTIKNIAHKPRMHRIHLDPILLALVAVILGLSFVILYSASNHTVHIIKAQSMHISLALVVMLISAQISPSTYQRWAPWLYLAGMTLLILVLIGGHIGKGAQRWLSLVIFRFQPSEIMKIVVPMFIAWYLHNIELPPSLKAVTACSIAILLPALLIIKQPDLGTAVLLIIAGGGVLFLAGLSYRLILAVLLVVIIAAPILWHFMHDYQHLRILTFINPERDPLGAGYHIIQSKIAIGSGGIFGKGWMQGTQSHLHFLPEHATDFIFAVFGEEFGLTGTIILLGLYTMVTIRGLYIAAHAQNTFCRLLGGGIALMFFASFFINIGMVTGIIPVVGVPLPLVSYGGTSMVTLMAGFGILMSIQTHRKLHTT